MRKYPEYKASGVESIGDVPENWEVKSLRRITKEHRQGYYIDEPYINEGVKLVRITDLHSDGSIDYTEMPFVKISEIHERLYKIEGGDFLFPRTGTIGSLGFVKDVERAVFASYLIRFRFKSNEVLNDLLYFYFMSNAYLDGVFSDLHGGVVQNIHAENIKNQFIAHPKDIAEQLSIVRFLDHKTGQMDRFIGNRQKQIELLKEQKAGIINKAVTKGLNSSVKFKNSGDKILGKVPEHWEVMELKYVARMMRGKFSHRPRNDERLYGGKYPFIQTGDVTKTEKYIISYKQTLNDWGFSVSKMFPKGTVVITIAANIGDIAILDFDACFPDSIVGFFSKQNKTEYLFYLLKSMKEVFLSESIEGTQLNLSVDRLSCIKVAIPNPSEQQEIIDFILLETSNTDSLIFKYQKQIDLMQEYRTSIISQAITGKIDVREWEPKKKKYKIEELEIEMMAEK